MTQQSDLAGAPVSGATVPGTGAPAVTASPSRRARVDVFVPVVVAIVFLAGVLTVLYPTASAWITQYQQSQLISQMSDEVTLLPAEGIDEELGLARLYNAGLTGQAVLEANSNVPSGEGQSSAKIDYEQLLSANSSGLMSRIKIPKISADLPIYHGTSDETLLKGIGHLQGTSLPVGGASTHSVLTGHRGLANAEMFTNLDRVAVGDTFTIEVYGDVLTYRVRETQVVEPTDTETLRLVPDADLVTLVTCTPLGINTQRILVTGERVTPTPAGDIAAAGSSPDVPGFPWWAPTLAACVLLTSVYLMWALRRPTAPRSRKRR
ncbi:class C sortase [Microbacterium sp. 2216-1]|uniref:class C sortase n=1 Tax=Microbacterium sp. 2216-1 TaxID=3390053 RepID=UPI0039762ED8